MYTPYTQYTGISERPNLMRSQFPSPPSNLQLNMKFQIKMTHRLMTGASYHPQSAYSFFILPFTDICRIFTSHATSFPLNSQMLLLLGLCILDYCHRIFSGALSLAHSLSQSSCISFLNVASWFEMLSTLSRMSCVQRMKFKISNM